MADFFLLIFVIWDCVICEIMIMGRICFAISAIVLMLAFQVESFMPVLSRLPAAPARRYCRQVSMQLADAKTKEIQEATRRALGHGADLKGLEFSHELSMNELAMRPWKTFFDTLAASKVREHPLFKPSTCITFVILIHLNGMDTN